jgi:putative heme iron utilization protein
LEIEYQLKLANLIRAGRTAALGTTRNAAASVSMVAYSYAADFSVFHLLTSDLALHTLDMQKDNHISLLITELDDGREDPLTLARVELRGRAEMMLMGEPGYTPARTLYVERFPRAAPLFEFGDFRFWRIQIKGGRYVAGFAKAFNLTTELLATASRAADNAMER